MRKSVRKHKESFGFSLSGKGTLDKVTHFLSEKENKTKTTHATPCKSKEQQKVQKKLYWLPHQEFLRW